MLVYHGSAAGLASVPSWQRAEPSLDYPGAPAGLVHVLRGSATGIKGYWTLTAP